MRSSSKSAAAGIIICLALVSSIVVLALRADGREATESTTNDGGAWLVNQRAGSIGHLNREVAELSAAVRISAPASSFEVHQPEGTVVVHATATNALEIVDQRTHLRVNSVQLPERATITKYDDGLVIAADGPFRIWRLTSEVTRDVQSLDSVTPIWEGDRSPFEVSSLGTVAVAGGSESLTVLATGDEQLVVNLGSFGQVDEVLFDGEQPVVRSGTRLGIVDDDEIRPVTDAVNGWQIDAVASTEATGSVIGIRQSGDVVRVQLDNGTETVLGRLDSRDPVAPIEHQGCVYAVGHEPPTFWVQCGNDPARSTPLVTQPNMRLRLRLVNDWVWVNDLTSGSLWLVDDERDLSLVDDWEAVLPQNPTPDDEQAESIDSDDDIVDDLDNPDAADALTVEADPFDDDGINEPPVAFDDDDYFTPTGRPIVIDVVANDEDPDNDVLLIDSVENLTGSDATVQATNDGLGIQVTPAPGFEGTIRFSYRITDGRGGSDTATGSVTVRARTSTDNSPPVAVTDVGSITAGEKLIINVLVNDYDPDGDSVVLVAAAAPEGSLSFDPSGQIIFEPDTSSEEGEIELTYRIADDFGELAEGRVRASIRLKDSNQPPDARNDGAVTVVGQPVSINLLDNDTDPDGDQLFVAQRPQIFEPAEAEVFTTITPDGEFVFIPDEPGTYLFFYTASDDEDSDTAQIRVEVSPDSTNRPPVAVRDDITVPAGESRIVYALSNDGDPDGDVVGIVDVSVTPGSGLRVEPFLDLGFRVFADGAGPSRREFRYSISDGIADPVETTVVVSVADESLLNQPPLAQPDTVEIRPGASVSVPVLDNDFDPEGGPLRVVDVSEPTGGTASIGPANASVRVGVDPDTVTSFSVSYDVTDEQGNRTASVIRVRVVPPTEPNRPPIARPDSARTAFETQASISAVANDSDPDGDAISIESITSQPTNGVASVDPVSGDVLYTPASGYSGTDRFSYSVVDALGARTIGEVLVGVLPEPPRNQDPIAIDDSYITVATGETIEMPVLVNDSDPDGDQLRISSVTAPTAGTVDTSVDAQLLAYTAPLQQDTDVAVDFAYNISDGRGGSASATITVLVQATPAQPLGVPTAIDDAVGPFRTGDEVRVDVVDNDIDPDGPLTELDVDAFAPDLAVEGQQVVFAAPAESGSFAYQITDINGNSATAQIIVEVFNPVPPVAIDDQFGPVKQGEVVQIDVLANDYDVDGEPEELELSTISGDAFVTDGVITLTAPADSTQYTYTIIDADGLEATATLSLIVTENRAPILTPQPVTTEFETPVQIDVAPFASDPDDDPLLFTCCQSARNGSPQVLDAGEQLLFVDFTPDDGFSGDAVFSFEVDDQFGNIVAGLVTVTVGEQPNRPPIAIDGIAEIQAPRPSAPAVTVDVDLTPLADDLDEDDVLTFAVAQQPGRGLSANVDGTTLRITATDQSDPGETTLDFVVTDIEGESSQATIAITILEPQNQPPLAADRSIEVSASNSTTIDLREVGTDTDPDEILTFAINAAPADGLTITLTGENTVTVAAAVSASGTTGSFSYTVTDRMNEEANGTISISVNDPDQARPTAVDDAGNTIQGVAVEIPVLVNDSDPLGQGLTIVDGGTTTDGTVTVNGDIVEFAPNATFFGAAEFVYTIRDAANVATREATATVSIEVTGRPSAPGAPTCSPDSRVANLTWTEPDNNGARIDGYAIEHDQGGTDTLGVATNHQWTELDNGTLYRFRIAAENVAGLGDFSPWSVPCRPNVEPEQPAPPQVTHGDTYLDITWSEPANEGTRILEYVIRIGGGVEQTSEDTSHRWPDLKNGDSFTFEVAARNLEGLSDFSTASTPERPSTTPAAPVIGTTTRAGLIGASASGILEINWTPVPVVNDGGDTVARYRIEREAGGSATVTGANASSYRWSGLDNGEDNRFRVFAINRDGDSDPSAWSTPTRACTVPSVPTSVSASPGDQQATVTFSQPSNNGGCGVTNYDLRIVGTTGNGTSHTTPGTKTVTGLNNSTTYGFEVRAHNVIGSSPWAQTNSVTPAGLPICGSGITVTSIGHNSASYSWGAANFNGGSPQGYELSVNNGSWTFASNGTTGTTAVNPDSSTTVRLRARNQLGVSSQCGSVTFQTCPATPPAPSTVNISADQTTRIVSTNWSTVTVGCTSQPQVSSAYDVVRYEIGPEGGSITSENGTSKQYGPLAPGTEMRVSVKACYQTGCGDWSPWTQTVQINSVGTAQASIGNVGNYPGDSCWNASSIIASGGNPDQGCYFIAISLSGWSTPQTVRCYSSMNTGVWQQFASFTAGNGTHQQCSYSQAGRGVLVTVNGPVQGDLSGWDVPFPAVAAPVISPWPTN